MNNLRLVIGIVVILAIVCSPALAISKADLLAQYQAPTLESDDETTFDSFDITESGKFHWRPYDPNGTNAIPMADTPSVKPTIPTIEPTTISTKPTPTPSPLTLDIYVENPYPATLIPSYSEYSKFAKPEPCIYGPPPGMSGEEYWEAVNKLIWYPL